MPPEISLRRDRMYRFLFILSVAFTMGYLGWRTVFNNFAVESAHLTGYQIGLIQGVREIPGLLTVAVIYFCILLGEVRMAVLSVVVCGLFIGMTGYLPSFPGLMITTLMSSFGAHFFLALNSSLALQYYDQLTAPLVLGRLYAYQAAGSVAMALSLFLLSRHLGYPVLFLLSGLLVLAAGGWGFFQKPVEKTLVPQHQKMIFRGRYWLFYALTLLAGGRRQIFVAFALYLLVQKFHYSITEIMGLSVITNVVCFFTTPFVGRGVNRLGERVVLSTEYTSVMAICLVYAFSGNRWLVGGMFVLDQVFFNFALAINTYFQKIAASQEEITSNVAMGQTINHLSAVFVPALGGLLWRQYGYQATFLAGTVIVMAGLVLTQWVRTVPSSAMEPAAASVAASAGPVV